MSKFSRNAIAIAIGLVFSVGAMAQTMSRDQYKARKASIAAEYRLAKAACASLAGNAKDICQIDASGKDRVAKTQLRASYKPSENASYKLRVVTADADYSLAKAKCDDKAGNVKDVCVKQAQAIEVAAKADAKTRLKTVDANTTAIEKTAKAQTSAIKKGTDARKEAASEKSSANYAVAKEKCGALAGNAKSNCIRDAKSLFDQS